MQTGAMGSNPVPKFLRVNLQLLTELQYHCDDHILMKFVFP